MYVNKAPLYMNGKMTIGNSPLSIVIPIRVRTLGWSKSFMIKASFRKEFTSIAPAPAEEMFKQRVHINRRSTYRRNAFKQIAHINRLGEEMCSNKEFKSIAPALREDICSNKEFQFKSFTSVPKEEVCAKSSHQSPQHLQKKCIQTTNLQ